MTILLINGVNLNMLGKRNVSVYGSMTLAELEQSVVNYAKSKGCDVVCYSSNSEGDIIDTLQGHMGKADGIVINAGAHSHYSYAIRDCLEYMTAPVVSVHLSDITNRESWRANDILADVVSAKYIGEGIVGYYNAIDYLTNNE